MKIEIEAWETMENIGMLSPTNEIWQMKIGIQPGPAVGRYIPQFMASCSHGV
jgi:hypothetical protein